MNEQHTINQYIENFTRVSPIFLVRKLGVTFSKAEYLCLRIWRRQWEEARKLRGHK